MASAEQVANALDNSGTMNQIAQNATTVNNAVANMYGRIDDILGISSANTAINLGEAERNRQFQLQNMYENLAFNSSEAAKNRAWQQMMSNTAHQREVQDLIAAGLNPVLSASGGNGAPVTSGATASGVMTSGAQGQADTSGTSGVVSVLGKAVDALSNVANTNTSAVSNLAIADKYNTFNEYIAGLDRENQQELAHIHGQYGIAQAATSGAYNLNAASVNAAASRYVANVGNQNAMINSNTSRYVSDLNAATQRHITDTNNAHDTFIHETYPNNAISAASGLLHNASQYVQDYNGRFENGNAMQRAASGRYGYVSSHGNSGHSTSYSKSSNGKSVAGSGRGF